MTNHPLPPEGVRPIPLPDRALHILLHALGVQRRGGEWKEGGWRNHYSTHDDTESLWTCKVLVAGGWMAPGREVADTDGSVWVFRVSPAGIAALQLAGWPVHDLDREATAGATCASCSHPRFVNAANALGCRAADEIERGDWPGEGK